MRAPPRCRRVAAARRGCRRSLDTLRNAPVEWLALLRDRFAPKTDTAFEHAEEDRTMIDKLCRTFATRSDCGAGGRASRWSRSSRSRSASAPTPRCSASSTPCCCGRCRIRTPSGSSSVWGRTSAFPRGLLSLSRNTKRSATERRRRRHRPLLSAERQSDRRRRTAASRRHLCVRLVFRRARAEGRSADGFFSEEESAPGTVQAGRRDHAPDVAAALQRRSGSDWRDDDPERRAADGDRRHRADVRSATRSPTDGYFLGARRVLPDRRSSRPRAGCTPPDR